MSDILNRDIVVSSIEKKVMNKKDGGTWVKYIILASNPENPDKPLRYGLAERKLGGEPTKAFSSMQTIRPMAGDTLRIGYKENPREFVDKTGVTRQTTDRNIIALELATGAGVNSTPSVAGGNVAKSQSTDDEISVEDIPY